MIPETDESKLRRLATHGSPPAHEWQPVALVVLDRSKRTADKLEVARVKLHNLDLEDCDLCGEWYGIEALDDGKCKECVTSLIVDAYIERRKEDRYETDRRAHPRVVERGMRS